MLPSPKSPGFLNCCSLPGSSREVIIHNASLLPSPQFSLSDAPLLGAQGGDQSPLLPVGVGPHRGLALGLYLILWPFLVSWSVPPMSPVGAWPSRESEHWSIREPGIPSGGMRPPSSQGSFTAPRLSQQSSDSRGRCCWNLGGASRNVVETSTRETKHLESWRTQVDYAGRPRGVNTPSSEPQTKGLQSFYTWTGMVTWVCGFVGARAIAKSRTRVSEIRKITPFPSIVSPHFQRPM